MKTEQEMQKTVFEENQKLRKKQLALEVEILESIQNFIDKQEDKSDFDLQLVNSVLLKISYSYSQNLVNQSASFNALMNFNK
jgi:hypothetical protein